MQTKSCNLTEDEIECLIAFHGDCLNNYSAIKTNKSDIVDRINYLHKRLKSFSEVEKEVVSKGWGSAPASSKGEDE